VFAYTDDGRDKLPGRSGGVIPRGDRSGWTTAELALAAVIDSGREGVTAHQISSALELHSDGISGSLVQLAQAGVVARLARGRTPDHGPATPDEEYEEDAS